jgi:3-hydroxyisobutyrate dehydrogenase
VSTRIEPGEAAGPAGALPRIGFIGLGAMGAPMAERLRAGGYPVCLWARRPGTLDRFPRADYARAASPAELGAVSDVVCVCVAGDDDVRAVLLGPRGVLAGPADGAVLLVHSTVAPRTCAELAQLARENGAALLDAPVSGGTWAAAVGTLTVMVGGDSVAFDQVRPVLERLGSVVRHMGEIGAGQRMKLLNNVLSFSNGRIASIAIENAVRLGLELDAVLEVLRTGSGRSFSLEVIADHVLPEADWADRTRAITAKDTELYAAMIAAAGLPADELLRLARQRVSQAGPELDPPPPVRGAGG